MLRILFFFMGMPMMIMSFFEAVNVLPYATDYNVFVNGNKVELSVDQADMLKSEVEKLFENSHTLPAFGVITPEMFEDAKQTGILITIKFPDVMHVNDLPFNELAFKVEKDWTGINLFRGIDGVFQGRCIYLDFVDKDMTDIYEFLSNISTEKTDFEQTPTSQTLDENS